MGVSERVASSVKKAEKKEGKKGGKKPGKQKQRDRDFGIKDKGFWDWWHKIKQKGGYGNIENKQDADSWYGDYKSGGF